MLKITPNSSLTVAPCLSYRQSVFRWWKSRQKGRIGQGWVPGSSVFKCCSPCQFSSAYSRQALKACAWKLCIRYNEMSHASKSDASTSPSASSFRFSVLNLPSQCIPAKQKIHQLDFGLMSSSVIAHASPVSPFLMAVEKRGDMQTWQPVSWQLCFWKAGCCLWSGFQWMCPIFNMYRWSWLCDQNDSKWGVPGEKERWMY